MAVDLYTARFFFNLSFIVFFVFALSAAYRNGKAKKKHPPYKPERWNSAEEGDN